jgi:hypothetical protein
VKSNFNVWKSSFLLEKQQKKDMEVEQKNLEEINDISSKYNKEIELLTTRLNETQRLLDEANNNQLNMQENLKRAFVRGVCALNFEAMNVLQTGKAQNSSDQLDIQAQLLAKTESFSQKAETVGLGISSKEYSSLIINPMEQNKRDNKPNDLTYNETVHRPVDLEGTNPQKKKIVIIQNPSVLKLFKEKKKV